MKSKCEAYCSESESKEEMRQIISKGRSETTIGRNKDSRARETAARIFSAEDLQLYLFRSHFGLYEYSCTDAARSSSPNATLNSPPPLPSPLPYPASSP